MKTKTPPSKRKAPSRAPARTDFSRSRRQRPQTPALSESWLAMPWTLRVLRAFLGFTFLFAGAQKFLDANFLHPGAASYIGNQLNAFAQGTPLAPLMHLLVKVPVLTGVGIALAEIAIGLCTLLGVGMLTAALTGALINFVLWLSATWHVHPYFLGSDSIYAVAWIALALGIGLAESERNQGRSLSLAQRVDSVDRRQVLRAGMIGALSLGVAVVSKAFAGPARNAVTSGLGATQGSPGTGGGGGTSASGATGGTDSGSGSAGTTIATLDQLPVGKAVGFNDPASGPAVLFRMANGNVVAYSRRCTHAGCPVSFDQGSHLLFCPCHGAEFDPAHGGAVVAPPAQTPLQSIPVSVVGNRVILSA